MGKALDELQAELGGGELPPELSTLAGAEAERLLATVREARARQRQALEEAIERSLGAVPALLRRAVRRVLFP